MLTTKVLAGRLFGRHFSGSILRPVRVDLQGLDWLRQDPVSGLFPGADEGGGTPPQQAVDSARQGLVCGVMSVTGHGVDFDNVHDLLGDARCFFDRPAREKLPYAVGRMDRSRGWELYPHHLRFASRWMEARAAGEYSDEQGEPSSRDGILCERFVLGVPGLCDVATTQTPAWQDDVAPTQTPAWQGDVAATQTPAWQDDAFYSSAFARVFYEQNRWPGELVPTLQARASAAYAQLLRVGVAMSRVLAAALGLAAGSFDRLLFDGEQAQAPVRHHSRLQINHYPSQLAPPRALHATRLPLRANTHLDTSLFTLLARDIPSDVRHRCGSSGALEVCVGEPTPRWTCVDSAHPHDITLQFGSLIEYLTNGRLRGVTHRVSNPPAHLAHDARRLSLGFVVKPDYTVPARPLPGLLDDDDAAAAARLPDHHYPTIGLVGRVGWQNHAMIFNGLSHELAVQSFKQWKLQARKSIGLSTKSYRTV